MLQDQKIVITILLLSRNIYTFALSRSNELTFPSRDRMSTLFKFYDKDIHVGLFSKELTSRKGSQEPTWFYSLSIHKTSSIYRQLIAEYLRLNRISLEVQNIFYILCNNRIIWSLDFVSLREQILIIYDLRYCYEHYITTFQRKSWFDKIHS